MIHISHPLFYMVTSKDAPGMVDYLLPKKNEESLDAAFSILLRNDKLERAKYFFSVSGIKLNDNHFMTGWGYAPDTLKWMIVDKNYLIEENLYKWIKNQPVVIMKDMSEVLSIIETFRLKNSLEKNLSSKEVQTEIRKKI